MTSKTMLNKSVKSAYPCGLSDHRENAFSFSPLTMMLTVHFSNMAFTILQYVTSMPMKLSLFAGDVILYIENPKDPT